MLPEVEAYFQAITVTPEQIQKKLEEVRKKYDERYGNLDEWTASIFRDFLYACNDVKAGASKDQISAAWSELKKSENPQVKYVAENFSSYHREHAEEVFKILPATVTELDQLAVDKGWCDDWDRFLARAQRDGVVENHPPRSAEREELSRWFRNNMTSDRQSMRQLMSLVNAIVAAEAPKVVGAVTIEDGTEHEVVSE